MLCLLNKYKDILGVPLQGIHKYRLLDTAIVDYIQSLILAVLITYKTKIPLVLTTILVLVISIISHMIFGVETNTIKYLGLQC